MLIVHYFVAPQRQSMMQIVCCWKLRNKTCFYRVKMSVSNDNFVMIWIGMLPMRRSKQVGAVSNRTLTGYFWRAYFDAEQRQIVTDRPVTDFVQ